MNDAQPNSGVQESTPVTQATDPQHSTEKLELENKTLRAVLESMPDNISIKDLAGRYILDNASHRRFLGAKDPAEVVGKNLFDFFPETIASKFHAEDLQVMRSGTPVVRCIEESVDGAGNSVWMSVTKMPLYDEEGELLGLVSTTRDITAIKYAEEQLAKYAQELREKNEQLEEDLETARELQNALLPQQYPRFPSSASAEGSALRFQHFFRSSLAIGGDFFHVFQISDSTAGVLIADVMGHGVRAALVAAILRTLVEDSREHATDPAKLLRELNRGISAILKHVHLPIFASACYLVADISRGELHYANAGHPTPLCVHREPQSAEPLPLTAAKRDPVLGIFANADYHSASCTLCAGDTVLLFTDGLFEVQAADAQYYDQSRLLNSVRQRVGLRADELCKELVDDVQQFAAERSFVDDVCLIAMEIDHLLTD
jgi:sigma-B regulation protein RsbU (phosphoserine phosphatase)